MIENRPAGDVIAQHDAPDTLFYVDPPYMHETRSLKDRSGRYYDHEMTDADHRALLDQLQQVKGMVVISGYRSPLYDELLSGWSRADTTARISANRGTSVRDQHIWLTPACAAQRHGTGLLDRKSTRLNSRQDS